MSTIIYHVTTAQEWQQAKQQGYYEAPSLHIEGFIHCSQAHQVEGVLLRYFKGKTDLVKLTIEVAKITAKFQYDYAPSVQEDFPHIYGPINLDAVVDVQPIAS